ncbi:MAG: PD-(D/E)XK nuclease family protein [Candidatus Caldarchaeum sp.]
MGEIPNRYEVLPIHASDISAFMRCRRYWDWSSPLRRNLRRRAEIFGIDLNLWFGSGIHYALEKYYDPKLRRDPVETFSTWFDLQWNGGVVTSEELNLVYDSHPREIGENLYEVRGLYDLLPDPLPEEFEHYRDLGIGMMTFYKDYASRNDDFEVVAAESPFSIPLGFEAVDPRVDSPNYGKKLEVHLRGKRDAVIYYPDRKDPRKQYGIIDHKTVGRLDESYFIKLENDPQCTTYLLASRIEAERNDLPWKYAEDILYQALRKVYPKPPTITSRGLPSLDRTKESTTASLFLQTVKELGLEGWLNSDERAKSYYEYLLVEGDRLFIQREYATRNQHQLDLAFEEVKAVAREMTSSSTAIYKHPSGMPHCTRCQFRAPCLAFDDGSDWERMLADGFEVSTPRQY